MIEDSSDHILGAIECEFLRILPIFVLTCNIPFICLDFVQFGFDKC